LCGDQNAEVICYPPVNHNGPVFRRNFVFDRMPSHVPLSQVFLHLLSIRLHSATITSSFEGHESNRCLMKSALRSGMSSFRLFPCVLLADSQPLVTPSLGIRVRSRRHFVLEGRHSHTLKFSCTGKITQQNGFWYTLHVSARIPPSTVFPSEDE
jgi:hypothetical protein